MKNEYGIQLDRNGYAPSIMQKDESHCFLCGEAGGDVWDGWDELHRHEAFGGALREKSKRLGLWCWLHGNTCHENGSNAVHQNAKAARYIKECAQRAAMDAYGWGVEDFIREFGKNYLD